MGWWAAFVSNRCAYTSARFNTVSAEDVAMRALTTLALLLLLPLAAIAAEEVPSKDAKSATQNLLQPTNDLESWVLELNGDSQGAMKVDGDAIVFTTAKTDGTDWHVQAYQPGLDLEEGKHYVVRFQMKSPDKVTLLLVGQIHEEDWHEIGLHEEIRPGADYDDYEYEFTAKDVVDKNNRVGLVLGISEGAVSVRAMTLTEKK